MNIQVLLNNYITAQSICGCINTLYESLVPVTEYITAV